MADGSVSAGRVLGERRLARGRSYDFAELDVASRDGGTHRIQIVRHPGAVTVLPILDIDGGNAIVLERNYRASLDRFLWELPAGKLDPGEAPENAAGRELIEETGYRAGRLTPLGRFYTTPGVTDELMWAFVATDLTFEGQRLEPDEELSVEAVGVERVARMVESGELEDAKSLLTLLLAARRGLLDGLLP